MNLHQIADCLSRGQDIVHPVVPLAAAVTDVGGVKSGGKPALLKDSVAGLVHEPIEMNGARMAVTVDIIEQDLRLLDILLIPPGAHLQRIELGPELPVRFTFLL